MKHQFKFHAAFTLIEVLAVVAVIGILSALAIGPIRAAKIRGRDSQRKADINLISQGIDLYLSEKKVVPGTNASGVCAGVTYTSKDTNWSDPFQLMILSYLPSRAGQGLPKDPVNNATYSYVYTCDSASSYTLTTTLENPKDPEGTGGPPRSYKLVR